MQAGFSVYCFRSRASSLGVAAFTLVELLVIIGIVGLLLALLVPALSVASRAARAAGCVSQLREIGNGIATRAVDSDGYAPLAGMAGLRERPTPVLGSLPALLLDSGRRRYAYHRYSIFSPWPEGVRPLPMAVLPYLEEDTAAALDRGPFTPTELAEQFESLRLFECPDAVAGPTLSVVVGWESITSGGDVTAQLIDGSGPSRWDYAGNVGVLGFNWRNVAGRPGGQLARVRDGSRIAMLAGHDRSRHSPFVSVHAYWQPVAGPVERAVTLRDALEDTGLEQSNTALDPHRHGGRTGVLFADGHAAMVPVTPEALDDVLLRTKE